MDLIWAEHLNPHILVELISSTIKAIAQGGNKVKRVQKNVIGIEICLLIGKILHGETL